MAQRWEDRSDLESGHSAVSSYHSIEALLMGGAAHRTGNTVPQDNHRFSTKQATRPLRTG